MNVTETKIKDIFILEPRIFIDERGWFMESFNQHNFAQIFINRGLEIPQFVQDNHSVSHKGVLRGLHYQSEPYDQGKLVRVVQGRAWDVAVDIRKNSETFGQWVGIELSAENKKQFWIPAGFAHGFLALEDNTQFLYKTTNYYAQEYEKTLLWNDLTLNIQWPILDTEIIINSKDSQAENFASLSNYRYGNE